MPLENSPEIFDSNDSGAILIDSIASGRQLSSFYSILIGCGRQLSSLELLFVLVLFPQEYYYVLFIAHGDL